MRARLAGIAAAPWIFAPAATQLEHFEREIAGPRSSFVNFMELRYKVQ